MSDHIALLNYLAIRRNYQSYLEIGCGDGSTFTRVAVPFRVGVDPAGRGTVKASSQEYFRMIKQRFDLVFIDGDHRCEAVLHDVLCSLDRLRSGGAIVVHDCLPANIEQTRQLIPVIQSGGYTGDGWRVIASLARHPLLDVAVGAFDYGCAVILPRGNPTPAEMLPATMPPIRSWTWQQYVDLPQSLFPILIWPELLRWTEREHALVN